MTEHYPGSNIIDEAGKCTLDGAEEHQPAVSITFLAPRYARFLRIAFFASLLREFHILSLSPRAFRSRTSPIRPQIKGCETVTTVRFHQFDTDQWQLEGGHDGPRGLSESPTLPQGEKPVTLLPGYWPLYIVLSRIC